MPQNQMPVKCKQSLLKHAALVLLPMLLATGCASKSPNSWPQPKPVQRPALPEQARQVPVNQMPSICSPSCTAGLTKLREQSLQSLTTPASVASPASAPTTR